MQEQTINLTPKEFELLYLLANNPGVTFSKEQIYFHVWKIQDDMGVSTVTDHISSLRRKLGIHSRDNDYIQTVFGVGYRFADPI